ncbi:hypothetical protein SFRURICE_003912, partial [Spodoptera frugiperda]
MDRLKQKYSLFTSRTQRLTNLEFGVAMATRNSGLLVGYFRTEVDGAHLNAYECAPTDRNMVRTYKPKNTSRQAVDEESMQSAIRDVMQGVLSYRKAADKYNLKLSTLESRVKKYKNSNDAQGSRNRKFDSKYTSFQVFSMEEEKLLNDYIIKCCKMHYVLERHPLTADRIYNFDESGYFLEVPRESTEQAVNSPLITTYDDELQRFNNLDAYEPDALNNSPIHQIVAPLNTDEDQENHVFILTHPKKKLIEEKHNEKQLKKLEQERRARARQMKRSLADFNLKTKNKKAKTKESDESDCDGSDISFQESSTSITDEDETEHENFDMNRSQLTVDVIPENIKDGSFILVRFPKNKGIIYYVGKVIGHYSQTEFKVSYLRKKPGCSWTFVFPNVEDIHTVYITDVEMILPEPKPST